MSSQRRGKSSLSSVINMKDSYIYEYKGVSIETLSDAELINILAKLHLDKKYDLETLTREELIDLCWSYNKKYDAPTVRDL